MKGLYLYHATDINNLDSIMEKGLLTHPGKHNWEGMYTDDGIYLAFDADVAESYAESADVDFDEIVILKVPLDKLEQKYIEYDWNNRCEYEDDINSCVYRKDIPAKYIEVTSSDKEPAQDIHDFKGTEMYDWILQTFDEEVETNLENEYDEAYTKRAKKLTIKESNKSKYDIAYNIASFVFGSPYSKDIDENIDFLVRKWFKQTTPDYKDRLYMCDTVDELASVLSEAPLRILQSTEIGLCIDDATIYGESFNRRKIYENDNYNYHYVDMEYTIPFITQQKAKEFGDWLQLSVIKGGKPDILCKSWYWEPVDGDMGQLKVIADDFTISLITMQVYRKGLVPEDTHWPSFVKFVEDSGKPVH